MAWAYKQLELTLWGLRQGCHWDSNSLSSSSNRRITWHQHFEVNNLTCPSQGFDWFTQFFNLTIRFWTFDRFLKQGSDQLDWTRGIREVEALTGLWSCRGCGGCWGPPGEELEHWNEIMRHGVTLSVETSRRVVGVTSTEFLRSVTTFEVEMQQLSMSKSVTEQQMQTALGTFLLYEELD